MKRFLFSSHIATILFVSCLLTQLSLAQQLDISNRKPEFAKGEILIKFKEGVLDSLELESNAVEFSLSSRLVKRDSLKQALQRTSNIPQLGKLKRLVEKLRPHHKFSRARNGEETKMPDFWNMMIMEVPKDADIVKQCETLSKTEGIEYAEPNYALRLSDSPANDFYYTNGFQRSLFNNINGEDIKAARAWDFSTGSYSIKVGIIDSGIDYDHPDLGNGAFGFEGAKVRGGWNYFNNNSTFDDDGNDSHGTVIAGIIGAIRNNNTTGIAGIAGGNAQVGNIGIQLFALKAYGTDRTSFISKIAPAVIEGASFSAGFGYGCHILNLSFGETSIPSGELQTLYSALLSAARNGAIIVAAKGNESTTQPHYPADLDDRFTIAVGASDFNGGRASFSNYGAKIDVVAPGTGDMVYSTKRSDLNSSNLYNYVGGTSYSTPHVVGLAALLRSVNPNLHPQDVEAIIRHTADKNGGYSYVNGFNENMGYGRINAGRALERLSGVGGWTLSQQLAYGGTVVGTLGDQWINFAGSSGSALSGGSYWGKRYEVRTTVPITNFSQFQAWTRQIGATRGWSGATSSNDQLEYCDIVSTTPTSITLRTFVYEIKYNAIGQAINQWYPCQPSQVQFAYTVWGVPGIPPPSVIISGESNPPAYSYNSYTANITGGAPPFSYAWESNYGTGTWYSVSNTNPVNFGGGDPNNYWSLRVTVIDAQGRQAQDATNIYFTGSGGPYSARRDENDKPLPTAFSLDQNYPNPFNPTTTISYALPTDARVKLTVFDVLGREVETLVNETKSAGVYQAVFNSSRLSSGTYFYRLQAGEFVQTKKMILAK